MLSGALFANEMFLTPPETFQLSGTDAYGNDAYIIRIVVEHLEDQTKLRELEITIYDDSISVDPDLLGRVTNPEIANLKVVNDIGVFGSYFSIDIPFGEIAKCRTARKKKLKPTLQIDSLDTMDEGGKLRARINDPCT